MIFNRDDTTSQSTKSKTRSTFLDDEFGAVAYKRNRQAKYVRIRVTEAGEIRVTLPTRAPLYLAKDLLNSSRAEIRKIVATQRTKRPSYYDGMMIGSSHRLKIHYEPVAEASKRIDGQTITVTLPEHYDGDSDASANYISQQIKGILRKEAMAYLPRRLEHLAQIYGFQYSSVRFAHQSTRWGSCSSNGTISLNISLMRLPLNIIDYVLVHELCHTQEMNHSTAFWQLVEDCEPNYRELRKELKTYNTSH